MALLYLPSYTNTMSMTFFVSFLSALLIQAQDQSGFISISCGSPDENYTDPQTGISYTSDANFINTGVRGTIVPELKAEYLRQAWTVRSFPDGKRNCYKINISRGSKYFIRTGSLYGNYDGLNKLPQFDIFLGTNRWYTVAIDNATVSRWSEIIHVPSKDYIHICLVNTGNGTPFISYIELRTLNSNTYVTQSGSLEKCMRWDVGSSNKSYRYAYDVYDRFWYGVNLIVGTTQLSASISYDSLSQTLEDWKNFNVSIPDDSLNQNIYNVPAIVMSSAIAPVNASAPLQISWQPAENKTEQFYVYMHFMEIEELPENQKREFNIIMNGELKASKFSPEYRRVKTIQSTSGISEVEINFSLEMADNSTLPPIINAIEIYRVIDFHESDTYQGDVDAITTIKSVYGVTRDWQGDPCAPLTYLWHGLNCSYNGNNSPRITSLNLSSSGLSGKIDNSISKLDMLEKLDLSNNNLNGEIPDFLSQLPHLKILNLAKNNLSGPIPSALKKGSLSLSVGQNPYLCQSGQCNEKKKEKSIVTPLATTVSGVVILLMVVAAILRTLKRRKWKALAVEIEKDQSKMILQYTQDDSLLQSKKKIYSYSDVLKITNNFNTIVGKGGFGTVYLGHINDTPVAVKILSRFSVHGYQQFQAEVNLLIRVHHRNLTSLVGYCNEGDHKGLIYEYMANGNLQEHLFGIHKATFLSWEDRLRIAVDAALGLEYLQKGCKPAIIHRDVKSTNILLNEHLQAKLSDFGLSKIMPTDGVTHVSTVIAGTPGYLDPESNRLTEKSDIYSFGVVLLEIITCQPVIAKDEEKIHIIERVSSLIAKGDIKDIVDSRLREDFDIDSAWRVMKIAMACISPKPNERPMMNIIVTELKESLATELARTKHINDVNLTRDTTEIFITSMNLDSELTMPR